MFCICPWKLSLHGSLSVEGKTPAYDAVDRESILAIAGKLLAKLSNY